MQSNIYVTHDGVPRVFPSESALRRVGDGEDRLSGAVRWMAPELLSGKTDKTIRQKSDVWSFGMTVYVSVSPFTFCALSTLQPYDSKRNC